MCNPHAHNQKTWGFVEQFHPGGWCGHARVPLKERSTTVVVESKKRKKVNVGMERFLG